MFYRSAKQDLGLTSFYAQSETAHFAHVELLFTAKTLLCYALWEMLNEEGADKAPTLSEMVRCFFNASCRICCHEQHIQVNFDISARRFASIFEKFWSVGCRLDLWCWNQFPGTA